MSVVQDIRLLAKGSTGVYLFDMSAIRTSFFEQILSSIKANLSIRVIGFNCDSLANYTPTRGVPSIVSTSIAYCLPSFFHRIVRTFGYILPLSVTLEEIRLHNIIPEENDFSELCISICQSSSLKSFKCENVPIGDEQFSIGIKILARSSITFFRFKRCNLSDDSFPALEKFAIQYKVHHKTKSISTMDFQDNSISAHSRKLILQKLGTPNTQILLTSNDSYQNISLENEELEESSLEMNFSDDSSTDTKEAQSKVKENKPKAEIINFFEEKDLEENLPNFGDSPLGKVKEENYKLHLQIDRLKGMIAEVKNNNALFIVGPGSTQLIEKMKNIDDRLTQIESNN